MRPRYHHVDQIFFDLEATAFADVLGWADANGPDRIEIVTASFNPQKTPPLNGSKWIDDFALRIQSHLLPIAQQFYFAILRNFLLISL
jgi:hypothetical protein